MKLTENFVKMKYWSPKETLFKFGIRLIVRKMEMIFGKMILFLNCFATNCNGQLRSSSLNTKNSRRDIDFYFKDKSEAIRFKTGLNTSVHGKPYKFHIDQNFFSIFGELKSIRTESEIQNDLDRMINELC